MTQTGKKKNDLTALKIVDKHVLSDPQSATPVQPTVASPVSSQPLGRKAKAPEEKESFAVGLRFTQTEGEALKAKAGRVPLATYLKDFIRDNFDKI